MRLHLPVGGRQPWGTEDFYPARVGAHTWDRSCHPHRWAPTRATVGMCRPAAGGRPHGSKGAAPAGVRRPHRDRKCHPAHVDAHMKAEVAVPREWAPIRGTEDAACGWAPTHRTEGDTQRSWAPTRTSKVTAPACSTKGRHLFTRAFLGKFRRSVIFSKIFCTFSGPMGAAAPV